MQQHHYCESATAAMAGGDGVSMADDAWWQGVLRALRSDADVLAAGPVSPLREVLQCNALGGVCWK